MADLQAFTLDKFLGINKSATETLLQLGEASDMSNWIITDDMKLKKVFGYVSLFDSLGAYNVKNMWYGNLNGINHFIFAFNGHIYEHNLDSHANTDLGAIANANPPIIFAANDIVYIIDGSGMFQWIGTGSISSVEGYVPTVFTASPPTGGGTILEGINYLTGKKTQKFSANGTATVYQLAELGIGLVDSVYVNGVLKTVTTDYTVDLAYGTVTFVTAPTTGVNNVVITWTKTVTGDKITITSNKYYGGVYYARFWLFGNPGHRNTRYVSGITMAGISDPTYWPKFTESDVGEHEITDIKAQYNKQLIWTNGDMSASAWYSEAETYTDQTTGINVTLFPVYPMSAKVGNVAKGQTQLIVNNPFTIWKGIYQWISSNIEDEKNAVWISKRIQNDLESYDLSTALTIDWSDEGLYLLCIGKKIWVYNYRIDVWYVLDIAHTPTCFTTINSELYFGTDAGQIMKFDKSALTFAGTTINATWKMGLYNFGSDWQRKFIQSLFVSIVPETRTYLKIQYQTDLNSSSEAYTAINNMSNFLGADFASWSFKTNYNPQPFKFKIRAKKIDYFKLILINDIDEPCTIISITLPTRIGGEVKRRY